MSVRTIVSAGGLVAVLAAALLPAAPPYGAKDRPKPGDGKWQRAEAKGMGAIFVSAKGLAPTSPRKYWVHAPAGRLVKVCTMGRPEAVPSGTYQVRVGFPSGWVTQTVEVRPGARRVVPTGLLAFRQITPPEWPSTVPQELRFGQMYLATGYQGTTARLLPGEYGVCYRDPGKDRPAQPFGRWHVVGPFPAPASAGDDRAFADADLTPTAPPAFDPKAKRLLLRFGWGSVTVAYRPGAERLDLDVTVRNDSKRVIERVDLRLLTLAMAEPVKVERPSPTVPGRWREISECNLGGPDLRRALHGERQILWLSLQPNRPMRQRLEPAKDGKQLRLTASAGHEKGGAAVYEGVWEWRPIRPGESDRYALSLRFAPKTTDPFAVAEDVYRAFGKAFPATLDWPDRRPMGALHIGDARRAAIGGARRRTDAYFAAFCASHH